jgi:outer membrane protein assembly factor BamB
MWKRGRYGFGQLIRVDDLLVIQMESGEVALVEASPKKHRELGRFQAIEGKTWNDPVLCRGLLFVRNDREAACYDVGLK